MSTVETAEPTHRPPVIGTFGVTSGQALAGVVRPLIEVPGLVTVAHVALRGRTRRFEPALVGGTR